METDVSLLLIFATLEMSGDLHLKSVEYLLASAWTEMAATVKTSKINLQTRNRSNMTVWRLHTLVDTAVLYYAKQNKYLPLGLKFPTNYFIIIIRF